MPIHCLTAGRMTMNATLLHRDTKVGSTIGLPAADIDLDDYGTWIDSQDPLTGEIVKKWQPFVTTPDNPATPDVNETVIRTIPCIARGIVDGGIRVAGTTERFGDMYENIDYVKMWIPSNVRVSKRDRVTNIMDPRGKILWRDEEFADPLDPNDYGRATVFNVNGVTPLLDAFNRHTESFVLLERATVYSATAD